VPNIGDRVRFESAKVGQAPRDGVVTGVNGELLHIEWLTGGESSFVPGAGSITIVGKVSGKRTTKKWTPARKAAKKAANKGTPVRKAAKKAVKKRAPAKKQIPARKAAKKAVKKRAPTRKLPAKRASKR